jgi:O-antigen/teichoic acid export membrane protein
LWFFFQTLIGFGLLADSGFGSNLTKAVSYFKSGSKDIVEKDVKIELLGEKPNYKGLNDLYYTSQIIYFFLSIISLLIISVVGFFSSRNLISMTDNTYVSTISFYIVVITCFVQIFNIRQSSFLSGLGYVVLLKRIDSLLGFTKLFSLLIILFFIPRLDFLFFALFLIQIIKNIVVKIFVRRKIVGLGVELNKTKFNLRIFKQLWKPTWKTSILNLSAYLINYSSSIVIVQISSANIIADFLLTQRIFNFLTNISINPFYAKIPHLASLFVRNKKKELFTTFSTYHALSLFVFLGGSLFVLFFGNFILDTFIKDSSAHLISLPLLIIFIVTLLLELNHSIYAGLYLLTNDVPFVIPSILSGTFIFIGCYFSVSSYGLLSIIVVPFIVQLCFNNWYPLYKVKKYFKINILELLLNTPKNLISSVYGKK